MHIPLNTETTIPITLLSEIVYIILDGRWVGMQRRPLHSAHVILQFVTYSYCTIDSYRLTPTSIDLRRDLRGQLET